MSDVTLLLTAIERGAGFQKAEDHEIAVLADNIQEDLIALNDALTKLSATDPQAARFIQLRYFVGLSIPDAAKALGISPRSADQLFSTERDGYIESPPGHCRQYHRPLGPDRRKNETNRHVATMRLEDRRLNR